MEHPTRPLDLPVRDVDVVIVLATFNPVAALIAAQVASIRAQEGVRWRCIVTDDASTPDGIAAIRAAIGDDDRFVLVEHRRRVGFYLNFERGLSMVPVGARFVALSDQDDVWHPAKLAACEAALHRTGALFVSHSATVVDHALQPIGRRRYPDHRRDAVRGALAGDPWAVPSGFASVFRRALLDDAGWDRRPASHQTGRPMNHDHVVSLRAFATVIRTQAQEQDKVSANPGAAGTGCGAAWGSPRT